MHMSDISDLNCLKGHDDNLQSDKQEVDQSNRIFLYSMYCQKLYFKIGLVCICYDISV